MISFLYAALSTPLYISLLLLTWSSGSLFLDCCEGWSTRILLWNWPSRQFLWHNMDSLRLVSCGIELFSLVGIFHNSTDKSRLPDT